MTLIGALVRLMDSCHMRAWTYLPKRKGEWRRKDILFLILYPACVISSWKANFQRLGCPAGSIIMKKKFERYNESFLNANFMKTQKYKSRMTTAIYQRSHMLHVGKEWPSMLPEQLKVLYSDQIEHLRSRKFYLYLTQLMDVLAFVLVWKSFFYSINSCVKKRRWCVACNPSSLIFVPFSL